MNWNRVIRQLHRWVSVVFTAGIVANLVAVAVANSDEPAAWVGLLALVPLLLLLLSGLYLFVVPYLGIRSRASDAAG